MLNDHLTDLCAPQHSVMTKSETTKAKFLLSVEL